MKDLLTGLSVYLSNTFGMSIGSIIAFSLWGILGFVLFAISVSMVNAMVEKIEIAEQRLNEAIKKLELLQQKAEIENITLIQKKPFYKEEVVEEEETLSYPIQADWSQAEIQSQSENNHSHPTWEDYEAIFTEPEEEDFWVEEKANKETTLENIEPLTEETMLEVVEEEKKEANELQTFNVKQLRSLCRKHGVAYYIRQDGKNKNLKKGEMIELLQEKI